MSEVTNDLDFFFSSTIEGEKISWSPCEHVYLSVKEEEKTGVGLALYIKSKAQGVNLVESLLKTKFEEVSKYRDCYICMAPDYSVVIWMALNNYEMSVSTLEYSSHKLLDFFKSTENKFF